MPSFLRHLIMLVGIVTLGVAGVTMVDRALFPLLHMPADDTDSPVARSGLGLRVDDATGCQYLESRFGGLTPRLAADDKHICKKG